MKPGTLLESRKGAFAQSPLKAKETIATRCALTGDKDGTLTLVAIFDPAATPNVHGDIPITLIGSSDGETTWQGFNDLNVGWPAGNQHGNASTFMSCWPHGRWKIEIWFDSYFVCSAGADEINSCLFLSLMKQDQDADHNREYAMIQNLGGNVGVFYHCPYNSLDGTDPVFDQAVADGNILHEIVNFPIYVKAADNPICLATLDSEIYSNMGYAGSGNAIDPGKFVDPERVKTFDETRAPGKWDLISQITGYYDWFVIPGENNYCVQNWVPLLYHVGNSFGIGVRYPGDGAGGRFNVPSPQTPESFPTGGVPYSGVRLWKCKMRFFRIGLRTQVLFSSKMAVGLRKLRLTSIIEDSSDLTLAWDFGDETIAGNVSDIIHQFPRTGYFDVKLTATNAAGEIYSRTNTVWLPFKAAFTSSVQHFPVPPGPFARVTFNVFGVNIATLDWDFGDGSPHGNTGPTVVHNYAAAGIYHVTLIAGDGGGNFITVEHDVVV